MGGLFWMGSCTSPAGDDGAAFEGNAAVSIQYDYGPFGEVLRSTGSMAKTNPFRFSTKYQDDETDLLYYGHRYEKDGRWLTRDQLSELGFRAIHSKMGRNHSSVDARASDGGLYCFVRNNPLNAVDPYGLAYNCQSATVYIFLNASQEAFDAGGMLAELRVVVPEQLGVYWKVFQGNLPPGSHLGFQGGIWPGVNCSCLYFVQANVSPATVRVGHTTLPIFDLWGSGSSWVANAYPNLFRWDFDDNKDYLPDNWQNRSSGAGWQKTSGFIMAHEVVHAIGGRHTRPHPRNLMSPSGDWNWLNFDIVPVAVSTSLEVRDLLLRWYPGNVTN
jgi:RHS repeat-associated protein